MITLVGTFYTNVLLTPSAAAGVTMAAAPTPAAAYDSSVQADADAMTVSRGSPLRRTTTIPASSPTTESEPTPSATPIPAAEPYTAPTPESAPEADNSLDDNATDSPTPTTPEIAWGVALWGLDLNDWYFESGSYGHGIFGQHYFSPTLEELDYFKSKGMTVIRLQFRWERIQHTLYGELDPFDMALLDTLLDGAAERGIKILLVPMNYARYYVEGAPEKYILGSPELPISAFTDLWTRLAEHYVDHPGIYGYSLMNEPNRMDTETQAGKEVWFEAAQAAISAIRAVDTETLIAVPGYFWSDTPNWLEYSDILINLVDPSHNMIYDAHCYLDTNNNYVYEKEELEDCTKKPRFAESSLTVGPDRLRDYVDWLRTNGQKGIISEMGVPTSPGWMKRFELTLDYISANSDVLVSFIYHVAGPIDREGYPYPMSIEPESDENGNYIDQPQMILMSQYIE